ncbi:MAG: outer membrane protein transport protein [Saprospiraceae bacterium]|nr:outer membrane protein transport protein [Saprospiraceae bacterium]MCF8249785.1 outer membrane protein transport protein [Saprospiraceae bacterium]MCF8279270.1 outer membrane protein transport protein [Bacteroidales bacterium]MCF8312818.1 outer membrane protein transport protein [Saprospiraceae bacterium]MCF8441265.1 outer membrane protein transport protein [Saprospiraceae bacterium]
MKNLLISIFTIFTAALFAQTGHVLQGAGAVNFSMGGAGTALPLDVNGALQWNPASITAFDKNEIALSVAYFTAAPEVYAKVTQPDGQGGTFDVKGTTKDEMGASPLPTLGAVFMKPDSKFAFGVSAFGISGFGVDYPATTDLPSPDNPDFNPNNANPLLFPQNFGGFGHLNSEYQLMQVGLTGAYEIIDGLSIGLAPTFNYSSLLIEPVPIATPSQKGYPIGEKTSALGIGAQAGIFLKTNLGFNFGVAYKTAQYFQDLEIPGKYADGSEAPKTNFNLDYPAILTVGAAFTQKKFDIAVDYRMLNYENTDGFKQTGWVVGENGFPTGAVAGFGWKNVSVVAAGVQLKMIDKLPIRLGYTYSSNPITEDNVFFSAAAPAVIEHAVQVGLSYMVTKNLGIHVAYHRGMSAEVTGQMMNPQFISPTDPLGKVPGSVITSKMHTDVALIGVNFGFGK